MEGGGKKELLSPRDKQVSTVNQDSIADSATAAGNLQSSDARELELELDVSEWEDQGDSMPIGSPRCGDDCIIKQFLIAAGDLEATNCNSILDNEAIQAQLLTVAKCLVNNINPEYLEDVLILVSARIAELESN